MTANDILEQLTLCLHGIIQRSAVQPELEALLNKANQLPPDAFVNPTDLVGFNDAINKISQLPLAPEVKGDTTKRDWKDQIYYHGAYIVTARIIYRITKPLPELSAAEQTILDTLRQKYYIGETPHTDMANKKLSSLFKTLSEEGQRKWTEKAATIRQNYTVGLYRALTNQTYVESLDDHHLSDVRDFFINSCFDKILTHYFRSHYGICNIRTYQFTPITKKNKKTDTHIGIHRDGLAKDSIKFMFFDGLITEKLGCLRTLNKKNVLLDSVTGLNPFLLFNPNITKHQAFAPKAGRRSTIEMTMMPTLTNELPVVDAGCKAGSPINPFKSWKKLI